MPILWRSTSKSADRHSVRYVHLYPRCAPVGRRDFFVASVMAAL